MQYHRIPDIENKQDCNYQPPRWYRGFRLPRITEIVISVKWLVAILISSFLLLATVVAWKSYGGTSVNEPLDMSSSLREAPKFSKHLVKFNKDTQFFGPPSEATETAWQTLFPKGRGFVSLRDRDPNGEDFSISGFHQIHCLYTIRHFFSIALAHKESIDDETVDHVYHCIEYLRQALVCSVDRTLDRATPVPGHPHIVSALGWGTTHSCRDYGSLFDWAEEHRRSNSSTLLHHIDQEHESLQNS